MEKENEDEERQWLLFANNHDIKGYNGIKDQHTIDGIRGDQEKKQRHTIAYNEVFEYIGHFGVYRLVIFILCAFWGVSHGYQANNAIFLGISQPYICKVVRLENFTYDEQAYIAIPWDAKHHSYSTCEVFDLPWDSYTDEQVNNWNRTQMTENASTVSCNSWVYDKELFNSTMVTKWDLVCGDGWLVQLTSTAYIAGMLVGSLISGILSDRYGRRVTTLTFSMLHPIFGLGAAFSPHIAAYLVLRFLMAICSFSSFLGGYVLVTELVGPRYRMLAGVMYNTTFAFGAMTLSGYAYAVREFIDLQLVMCLPVILTVFYWLVLPESPRWLVAKGRTDEAKVILKKIANINGSHFPDNIVFDVEDEKVTKQATLLDLFSHPGLRKMILIMYYVWFTNSLLFYGLGLNVGNLVGDIFLNNLLMSGVDIPANLLGAIGNQTRGRRFTTGVALLIGGLANFGCIPLLLSNDLAWLLTTLTIVGKGGSTVGFSGVFLMTAELFPTQLRQVAMGSSSMLSRVGGMIAPYVGGPLSDVWKALPSVIFGVFGVSAGVAMFFLPETLNRKMPDSIEEAEMMARMGDKYKASETFNGKENKSFHDDDIEDMKPVENGSSKNPSPETKLNSYNAHQRESTFM